MLKDESILKAVKALDKAFGPSVQIADFDEGVFCAIGFQAGSKLFYINSLGRPLGFYKCVVKVQPPEVEQKLDLVSLNELVEMIRQQLSCMVVWLNAGSLICA